MSPRRLDGWEPTTVYVYDDDGRLVASTPESEWSEQDVAWLLALAEWRAGRCPACGGDLAECTAADADGQFEVAPPTRCHAATATSIAQRGYRDSPQPEALLWRVKRRDVSRPPTPCR